MRSSSTAVPIQEPPPGPGRAAFDSLLEAAGDIVFRLTPSGLIRFASLGACRALGAGRDLLGTAFVTLLAEPDQGTVRNALVDAHLAPLPALVEARLKAATQDIWFELRIA